MYKYKSSHSFLKLSLVLVLVLQCVSSFAQQTLNQRQVQGRIVDFVNNAAIDGIRSELLTKDSVFVKDGINYNNVRGYRKTSHFIFVVDKPGEYLLRFTHPNYETYYQPLTVKFYRRESLIDIGTIPMKRIRNVTLDEVVITKTKLKFYFKKDTLVYNADAFLTQEGFVLNEILRKMPGIVVKPNGEIEANGRKVASLLLNGKDFFNRDRKTLLENMPAFMVQDVRFYEKKRDSLSLIKRERDFSGYVMDIKLKKEYQSFLLGNTEMAAGIKERYYAKLFGLKYNAISKVYGYAVANNINRDETIAENGIAVNHSNGDGDNKSTKAGVSYDYDHPQGLYSLQGDATVNYRDAFTETRILGQTFLSGGDVYSRQLNQSNNYLFSANTRHAWNFFGNTLWDFTLKPSVEYTKNKGNGFTAHGTFTEDVDGLWGDTWVDSLKSQQLSQAMELYGIYKRSLHNRNDGYSLQAKIELDKSFRIPHTKDVFLINAKYRYHKTSSEILTKDDIAYKSLSDNLNLARYVDNGTHDNQYDFKAVYSYAFNDANVVSMSYDYDRTTSSTNHPVYSLHNLIGWDSLSQPDFGILPSQEELLKIIDTNNSYSYSQTDNLHRWELTYTYSKLKGLKKTEFSISLPFEIRNKKLDFSQVSNDTIVYRKNTVPLFSAYYSKQKETTDHHVYFGSIQYECKNEMPSLYNLLNIRNDENPLVVTQGNPELKNQKLHHLFGQLFMQTPKFYVHRMTVTYDKIHDKLANLLLYDRQTGVTYITPRNIDGNWTIAVKLSNSLYVRRDRMVSFSNEFNFSWQNCADYISADISTLDVQRVVRNIGLNDRIDFLLSTKDTRYRLDGFAHVSYSKADSKQETFANKDLLNYGLQCRLSIELPHNYLLQSSLTSVHRHGYNFTEMDDEEYIWSANVIKKFGEKISLNLELYDILGQRKNLYHYLNAQGCSDIFYNNMKRYVMLHFIYRLSPQSRRK